MASLPQYRRDESGRFDFRIPDNLGSYLYPDWDDPELKVEFRDSAGVLQFTATPASDPPLTQEEDGDGYFVAVEGLDLAAFALGNVEAGIYCLADAEEVQPYPTLLVAFAVIEGEAGSVTDLSQVRRVGNLPQALDDDLILESFPVARRRIIRWIGSAAYADALLETPTDLDRAAAIADAEAHLVVAEGLPAWSRRIGPQGNLSSGRDGDKTSFTLLSPAEVDIEVQRHVSAAERALADYLSDPAPAVARALAQDLDEEEED